MGLTPRVEIDLAKIKQNAKILKDLYGKKGIQMTAVVKGVAADIKIAETILESGITSLADSKISNLEKLKKANLKATMILLRTPAPSEIEKVVQYADISMNTEIGVIRALSNEAIRQNKKHKIIIMVEMGDLREGIMLKDAPDFIRETLACPGIEIVGIGTNFACFGGVVPTEQKMNEFSEFAKAMEQKFSLHLSYVSGGNSANYNWLMKTKNPGAVNHIRIGESIWLGRETATGKLIPQLHPDAFRFIAEVIESNIKPSVPFGSVEKNAFGESVSFENRGNVRRAIINAGRQDILVSGLTPMEPFELLGSSSDHMIIDSKHIHLQPGDEISFFLNYGALISAMTSPYVYKMYKNEKQRSRTYPCLTYMYRQEKSS
ncbi:alanine/ornithine racemase family PLP-dependent enzyme [Calidifontibacillus erzurumensis]|uniref:Alanine/ornithine racemase family PLP-dependent enzyme n=1 Tax=Calidifontibacillus erzurumensis TaxID=2741433 RepID=A0A8J8GJE4_9BACI|nr:alanine/ornithine racemase family PLP-dependent enzyme [Calidifontibacillus erzurumensis]NSL52846.1 alanine/ornithine racemase family PLP-dependent enzyme [Calidifontibacillus erzurumensis]